MQERSAWLELDPQTIPVVVREGRVFHDNFEMNYQGIIIRTRGSVGFDQTMNLVAEIPILEKWLDGSPMLDSLKGKTISIPIRGTVSKPQLDRRAITDFARQAVRDSTVGAARQKVDQEVNKLQQKFGGKLNEELGRFQNKVNGELQGQIQNKLQDELKNGLQNLFGGDKSPKPDGK